MADRLTFVDTHCHLAAPEFDRDRGDVIERAREAGVIAALTMGEDYEDNLRVLDVAAKHAPFIRPALGHHPWRLERAARDVPKTLRLLEENRDVVVAIGEVGLDYRLAETDDARAEQRAVFRDFVDASQRLELPLSIHVRSAGHYVLDMLRELGATRAALHAFDGKARYALEGTKDGFFFSIPGTVLVSRQKEKLVRALPDGNILLESDAPALPPEKKERNEPMVIARAVTKIAELRKQDPTDVARLTLENTRRLFDLDFE